MTLVSGRTLFAERTTNWFSNSSFCTLTMTVSWSCFNTHLRMNPVCRRVFAALHGQLEAFALDRRPWSGSYRETTDSGNRRYVKVHPTLWNTLVGGETGLEQAKYLNCSMQVSSKFQAMTIQFHFPQRRYFERAYHWPALNENRPSSTCSIRPLTVGDSCTISVTTAELTA